MNYFKITLAGESEMSHDEIAEHLGTIMDFAEQTIHGEIGILTYSPTDEQGETLKPTLTDEEVEKQIESYKRLLKSGLLSEIK